ncbi:MAG: zf-HC2 domain-containing protein, partial [Planctomycetia bacterium]|nr:zf-HC2 domain-containing protein [Planctomycetia bacterium]
MLCENVKQKLYEFVFDLLNEDEKSEVAKHLASCAECRREHESALGERDLLKEWSPAAAPTGLADETIRAAGASPSHDEAAPREPIEPQMSWLGSRRFWAAAAAGFVLFVGGIVIQSVRMSMKEAGPQEAFVYGQSHLTPSLPVAYRVFVRNGVTAEPISGADVSVMLVSSAGDTVWSTRAVTGDDGIVHIEPDLPDDLDEGGYTLKVIAESDAVLQLLQRWNYE